MQIQAIDEVFAILDEEESPNITNWLGTLGTTGAAATSVLSTENSARSGRNSTNTTTLNNLKATLKTERETKEAAADRLYRNTEQNSWNDYLTSVQSANTVYLDSIKTSENTYKTASDAAESAYRTTSVTAYTNFSQNANTLSDLFYDAVATAESATFNLTNFFGEDCLNSAAGKIPSHVFAQVDAPPTLLVHATTPEAAVSIVTNGLRPGYDGLIWTITPDGAEGPGRGVGKESTVRMTFKIDITTKIKDIPEEIIKAANKFANAAVEGKGLPEELRNKTWARSKWNYIAENYIMKVEGDVFRTPNPSASKGGRGVHYAFKPSGWYSSMPKIAEIAGPGSEAAINALQKSMTAVDNGAVKAAEQRWGNRVKLIGKWGGRILVFVALGESAYTIYQAENKAKAITTEVGGWTGAWLGAKGGAATGVAIAVVAGNAGPQAMLPEELVTVPAAAGVGGLLGGIGGGIGGFFFGKMVTETVYEWIFE